MKRGTSKVKLAMAIALGIVAAFMVTRTALTNFGREREAGPAAISYTKGRAGLNPESLDPRLHLDLLASSESVMYEGEGKNIFQAVPDVVIPPVKVSPLLSKQKAAQEVKNAAPAGPPPPPPPPPINLTFFGYSSSQGEKPEAFLAQGDNVWIAHEGDVVNRQYKIVQITPNAVEVEDLLNNNQQSIRLTQG
jgi:hypothetical protein